MAKLNQIPCAIKFGNTGMPSTCTFTPDIIIGDLAVPKGTVFTAAQMAVMQDTLQALLINTVYGSRGHLFGKFESIEDQSEDRQQQTFGTGRKITVREKQYYWRFQYIDGGMCKLQSYQRFNNREDEFDHLFVDRSTNLIGTVGYDADGLQGLKGFAVTEFRAEFWTPNTGSETVGYYQNIGLADGADINQNLAHINLGFDIFDLNLVQDGQMVQLSEISGTGGVNIDFLAGCGNGNLVEAYGTSLIAAANFTAVNNTTQAAVTITSVGVAGTSPNKYAAFDFDSADSDYPVSGDYLKLIPDGVADLATAGAAYYDIRPILILIP